MNHVALISVSALALLGLSGCATLVVGGAAVGGVTASQERSFGSAIDDVALDAEINHVFIQSNVPGLYANVNTNIHEGRVLLTGDVTREDIAAGAVRLVWSVEGVREVINEIQVVPEQPVETKVNDEWINAQLDSQLLFTKGIQSVNYSTRVINGVVYMIGVAQSQQELNKAIYVAQTISGVKKVVNHVILKNDPRRLQWLGHPVDDAARDSARELYQEPDSTNLHPDNSLRDRD